MSTERPELEIPIATQNTAFMRVSGVSQTPIYANTKGNLRKLKVLLIGAAFSADLHSDGYSRILDKVDIVGICDKAPERIKELAERYGLTGYTVYDDYDTAIAQCDCVALIREEVDEN